jgi:nitrite reductase/ring-hydroxylating ferredoxin subunit
MYSKIIFFSISVFILIACKPENKEHPVPHVYVNKQIQTNDPRYSNLSILGGYAYIGDAGYKGILVLRTFDGILYAMDRACTYHPTESCARVTVDSSGIFIRCGSYSSSEFEHCCTSRYYSTGEVMEGPARHPLKHYRVHESGVLITITND